MAINDMRGGNPAEKEAFIDQSVEVLQLTVVSGPFDTNQFTRLKTAERKTKHGRVEVSIIGESCVVSVENCDHQFHEVFACQPCKVEDHSQILFQRQTFAEVTREHGELNHLPCLDYQFSARLRHMNHETERDIRQQLSIEETANLININFPFPKEQESDQTPYTVVTVAIDESTEEIKVRSIHSYPTEKDELFPQGRAVFTESVLSVNRALL